MSNNTRFQITSFTLATIGVLLCPPVLVRLFPSVFGNSIQIHFEFILWFIFLLFFSLGLLLFFYGTTPSKRKKLLFSYLTVFLMIFLVEFSLHIAMALKPEKSKHELKVEFLLNHSIFKNKEWSEDLLKEWSEGAMDFSPFLTWERKEYHGKYINVDSQGVRSTWNPASYSTEPQEVYVFGGSTMWGESTRDDGTIPSFLSKDLNNDTHSWRVYNYGQTGYTFLQEIVRLTLLLRKGHRPDIVVFYDGTNDVYASYQSGRLEYIHNADIIRRKIKARELTSFQHFKLGLIKLVKDHCCIYKAFHNTVMHFRKPYPFTEKAAQYSDEQIAELAREIHDSYLKSYDLVEHLSIAYGFDFFCFWQPTGLLETHLTQEEENSSPRYKDLVLKKLYDETNKLMEKHHPIKFANISDILTDRTESYYMDACHLSEKGNSIVSETIAKTLHEKRLVSIPNPNKEP